MQEALIEYSNDHGLLASWVIIRFVSNYFSKLSKYR